MIFGFVGALFSATPAVAILTSETLRRKPMFQTLANLSLNETLFLFGCGIAGLLNVTGNSELTPFWCALLQSHNTGQGVGSTAALLGLTVERYVAILHGLRYNEIMSTWRMRALLAASWVVSFVWICMLAAGMWDYMYSKTGDATVKCLFLAVSPDWVQLLATGSSFVFCCIIIVLNVAISRVAASHERNIQQQRCVVGIDTESNIRAYRGVLKVIIIYMVLQTPVSVVFLLEILGFRQTAAAKNITVILLIALFSFDGWLFGYNNSELRKRYIKLFCPPRWRTKVEEDPTSRAVQSISREAQQSEKRTNGHLFTVPGRSLGESSAQLPADQVVVLTANKAMGQDNTIDQVDDVSEIGDIPSATEGKQL